MSNAKCCSCKNPSQIRHEALNKDFCYSCWEKYLKKRDQESAEDFKKEQGVGLYKWVE